MKFYHLSDKPFTKLRNRKLVVDIKPGGVWLAPSGVWKKYIKEEMDGEIPKYEYEFDVDMTKILTLNTYKDISEFNQEYTVPFEYKKFSNYLIDWGKVQKKYSGIYFKNAQIKKARDEFMWYNSIDIESICVWANLSLPKLVDPS
jgi:hypothetical protein